MKPNRADGERILAVFIDFENLALGFGGRRDRFNIEKVLERLVEKGKIVAKKAYADWSRFGNYAGNLHASAVELVEIPKRTQTGKNSADIRMCVDAMDLAYSKDHIDTFVVVSGDSDFSPLVSKLKELGKHVIGLGLVDSTSELLRDNCDEFIYYEDLDRAPVAPLAENVAVSDTKKKAFALLIDSLLALRRENKEQLFSSMVKDTMKRKKPSFNEEYHGYRTFSDLLEDAQRHGLLDLERHKTSGTYVVTRFGSEPKGLHPVNGNGHGTAGPPSGIIRPPAARVAPPPAEPAARPQATRVNPPSEPPARRPVARGPERPEPPPEPRRRPVVVEKPSAPPPPPPADDAEVPLGRALMEDLDDLDVPSYRPSRSGIVAKPTAVEKPAKPEAKPRPRPAAKAEPAAAPKKVAEPKKAVATKKPAEAKAPPVAKPEAVAKPVVRPAPAKPAAPVDDDFGSGLDL